MARMQTQDDESGLELPFNQGGDAAERFDSLADEALDELAFGVGFEAEQPPNVADLIGGPTLRAGSSGARVRALQLALARLGEQVAADGRFGPGTTRAVKAFQSRSGLTADGIAGPGTKAAIAAALGAAVVPIKPSHKGSTAAGRLVVDRHPFIREHRGTSPDLVLRWNQITQSGAVDVAVHFHGYSGQREAMRIDRHKEASSGLDFANPQDITVTGRTQPTVGVLPRGNYFGGQSGSGYNFPELTKPGAVRALVQDALQRVSAATGHSLQLGRLIITGHSGGGAPISAVVADADPDEVHIFDGTYGSAKAIAAWARQRIAREMASASAVPPALRVLYRPGTQTESQAKLIAAEVCASLHSAAAAPLRARFRVDATRVGHNEIPAQFGWRLLADAGANLPDASTLPCPHGAVRETFETVEAEASPYWQTPATEREQSAQEAISMAAQGYTSDEAGDAGEDYIFGEDREGLAWLDVEAQADTEAERAADAAFEAEDFASFDRLENFDGLDELEAFEPGEAEAGFEAFALEQLLDAEQEDGGLIERVKGLGAFVLGGTLRRGSTGVAVETLQRCLVQLGHAVAVDGNYGPGTERAVRAFQSSEGIAADGICGPRTKAAIAAAIGRGAAPSPGPTPLPVPTPTPSSLADAIRRVAEEEYRRWRSPVKLQETDTAATPILQKYYREGVNVTVSARDLQDSKWQRDNPWSAVFISYVMQTAGAGTAFNRSAAHRVYVAAARRNRLNNVTTNPFWAYRATEVAPQVGDLVCKWRNDSSTTYDNIGDGRERAAHCDIVTEVKSGWIRVVGGNVNQDVGAKELKILPDGRIDLSYKARNRDQSSYIAVVRCRGPVGSTVPQPVPVPPTPQPVPAPAGQKLTPAVFVATYGPAATLSQAKHGVPSLVTLGQAALESGWGKSAPRFNFFGIKAKASDPEPTRQLLRTREVMSRPDVKFPEVISVKPRPDGKYDYVVKDWFRAYPDAVTAFDGHGAFLVQNRRYAKAFNFKHDAYAFAAEVARAGYATDPSYESVLKSVMRKIESMGGQREAA